MAQLRALLEELGLGEYAGPLEEAGYDTLDALREMARAADFAVNMGEDVGMTPAHAQRLQMELLEGAGSSPLTARSDSSRSPEGGLARLAGSARQELQAELSALDLPVKAGSQARRGRVLGFRLVLGVATLVAAVSLITSLRVLHGSLNSQPEPVEVRDRGLTSAESAAMQRHFAQMEFSDIWPMVSPWTMVEEKHVRFIYDAVTRFNAQGLEGDLVECGVWKGGVAMMMAFSNMRSENQRHIWLYDTFEGTPQPSEKDDARAYDLWSRARSGQRILRGGVLRADHGKWDHGPMEVVRHNMHYTLYPAERVHFVRGEVEESLRRPELPEKVAVLHLNTVLYSSTKAELEVLYDRLVPGALLFLEDFCTSEGASKAAKDFFAMRGMREVLRMKREQEKTGQCFFMHKI